MFDGSFFRQNPVPFYRLVREIYPERLEPTLTHRFFKLLENKGILTRVFTQNIDALEFLPHLDPEKVVEVFKKIDLPFFRETPPMSPNLERYGITITHNQGESQTDPID